MEAASVMWFVVVGTLVFAVAFLWLLGSRAYQINKWHQQLERDFDEADTLLSEGKLEEASAIRDKYSDYRVSVGFRRLFNNYELQRLRKENEELRQENEELGQQLNDLLGPTDLRPKM